MNLPYLYLTSVAPSPPMDTGFYMFLSKYFSCAMGLKNWTNSPIRIKLPLFLIINIIFIVFSEIYLLSDDSIWKRWTTHNF